jgi:hypothetical protein
MIGHFVGHDEIVSERVFLHHITWWIFHYKGAFEFLDETIVTIHFVITSFVLFLLHFLLVLNSWVFKVSF